MTGENTAVRAYGRTIGREKAIDGEKKLRGRGAVAMVVGMIIGVVGMLGAALPAAAAPTVTYPGAIANVSLENQNGGGPLDQWDTVRISGEWKVPAGAQAGETFGMTLPAEFSRLAAGEFTISDPATGELMANCMVSAGQGPDMVCTLTEAVNGKEDVGGTFWMQARASQSTTNETVEFDLGDTVEIVDLPGDGGIVPVDPTEQTEPYKYGGETATDGRLKWVVGIPSGFASDGAFTITDTLDPGLADHHYTGEVRLSQRPVENGMQIGNWSIVDPSRYQIVFAADGQSFEFTASGLPAGGFAYELLYYTQADGPVVKGDVFGNHAVVDTVATSATHTITESGGGDGTGVTYTTFSISKALTGAQAAAAQTATYTVRYSLKGSDAPAKTMVVPVGQPVVSDRAPLGSTFVIEEIDLPAVDGVSWGTWTVSGDGVVDAGNGTFEVTPGAAAGVSLTLTNIANPIPVVEPTPTPTATPTPTPTRTPASATMPGELALTGGGDGSGFLALAAALIVGGGLATAVSVKRRSSVARR
ncbi:Ig-like domain-containing protein [Microbacterium sp. LWH13-1.2]|uniref:Ig-like domain-containing protein n=1 Tax=Microbacterium sp. LWH13-1.2 TaxID=3135260 RepID=UPI003139AF63